VLEPLIVEQFIENAPDAEVEALKAHFLRLKEAYLHGNAEEIVASKRDFYDRICTGARNPIAFGVLSKLTVLTSPLRRRSVVRPERRVQSIAEIEKIVTSIAKRDKAAAKAAAEEHVAHSARSALHASESAN
jgi:GntR family transcriptional regulator, trigonelline degradation regulator